MNEEVLKDLYNRAVSSGYKKSINDFQVLLNTNKDVFEDSYSYVRSKGFGKDRDAFAGLVGSKKKETTELPSKQPQESGSLGMPEMDQPKPLASSTTRRKVKDPWRFNKSIESSDAAAYQKASRDAIAAAKSRNASALQGAMSTMKAIESMYGDAILNDSNLMGDRKTVEKLAKIPELKREEPKLKIPKNMEIKVSSTPLPEELEKQLASASIDDFLKRPIDLGKIDEDVNNIMSGDAFSEKLDNFYDEYVAKPISNYPYATQWMKDAFSPMSSTMDLAPQEAKISLEKRGIKNPTKEEITEEVRNVLRQKKIDEANDKAVEDYFEAKSLVGRSEEQEELNTLYGKVASAYDYHVKKFESKSRKLEGIVSRIDELNKKPKEELTPEDLDEYNTLMSEGLVLGNDLEKNYKNINSDYRDLGDFSKELDRYKRNYTYITNAGALLAKGALGIAGGVSKFRNMVSDMSKDAIEYATGIDANSIPTFDPFSSIGDYADIASKAIDESTQKKKSVDQLSGISDWASWAGGTIIEQAPQLAMAYLTGGASIPLLAGSAAGNKYGELLEENKSLPEGERKSKAQIYTASIGVGLFEGLSEKIQLDVMKNIFPSMRVGTAALREDAELLRRSLRTGMKGATLNAIEKTAKTVGNINQEGVSELVAQIGGNVVDRFVLGEKDKNILDGVPDAYLSGAVVGGAMTVSPFIASAIVAPFNYDPQGEIKKNVAKINELAKALELVKDDSDKAIITGQINKLLDKNQQKITQTLALFDSLSIDEKKRGIEIVQEMAEIKSRVESNINDPTMPKEVKTEVVNALFEQYNELVKERTQLLNRPNAVQEQTTSEVPVQPEAAASGEVAQGESQAEPQVATEEGVQEIKIDRPSITSNAKAEVDAVVSAAEDVETGQTFNMDGTVYSEGGLVVPVVSENLTQEELTPERIADFLEANKDKIGSNSVKVGIYKFPGSNQVSIDLNIVVPKANREAALEFGRAAGQESLFDLDMFENVKTGADGKNPLKFTPKQFVEISKALEEGRVPDLFQKQQERSQKAAEKVTIAQNVSRAIQKLFPKLKTVSFKNAAEMRAYATSTYGQEIGSQVTDMDQARVLLDEKNQPIAILLNEELSDATTMPHEAWHPILLKAFGDNQQLFEKFRKSIDRALREAGYDDIADRLDIFASDPEYIEQGTMAEEWLVQFGGMLAASGIDPKNLKPSEVTLFEKIKSLFNEVARKLTGQNIFLEDATPETILDFMVSLSDMMSRGEDISGMIVKPTKLDENGDLPNPSSRAQKAAIEILDGPKFDNKLKEDVASYLNTLRDSEIPPNSSREQLIERFINNVYEEVGYYLFSKPDARSAGLTWYIEDMVEFENKVKVILPELSNENQYKLFLSILAFTSSGTNPNQNLSYAYNLWNNSNDPKNFDFSKDWGDKKLSFVDKKGKAVASGVIVKETAREYTVELVDSLGRPEVDSKGNKKYEKVSKASMKPGYPKPTGYTNRGKIIVGQLEKLEKLYADLKSIDAVVKWLETPHPIAELRKYNEAVPDINGKGPGNTNKKYDPSKNAEGERNGAFIFGEKIGSFYQNMIGIGETITMDLWWSRTWNRYMGTMINTMSGNKEIQEVPRNDRERNIMREAVKMVAEDLNLQVSELQAAIWYFEQELWTKSGNASPSYSYVTAIDELTEKLKVDEKTRTKLRAAEADLTEAEKRRKNAAERAAAVVASKGGEIPKVEVTTKAQKKSTYTDEQYSEMSRNGILFHAGSESIADFNPDKIKGGARAKYGWGVYFAKSINKASEYGDMITFLDSKRMNLIPVDQPATSEILSRLNGIKENNPIYDLFLNVIKNNPNLSLNEARIKTGDKVKWDYDKVWSNMFLDAGYDGFNQSDYEYVVFNIEKANENLVKDPTKITTKASKYVPERVEKLLTEDGNGNFVFHHYSFANRDEIKPSTGDMARGFTSKEEAAALSSVGGLAMYYAQQDQVEAGVGPIRHTVVVPKDKVYYMTEDPLNFYDEAKERFLKHMNRGKDRDKWTEFAFNGNYQVAWISKVAAENGFDMVLSKWRNDADFRAQTVKTLKPIDGDIKFKDLDDSFQIGDLVKVSGRNAVITDMDENGVITYKSATTSGKFDIPHSQKSMRYGTITMIDKGPYVFNEETRDFDKITTKASKVSGYNTIPGYDRMRDELDGVIKRAKSRGASKDRVYESALAYMQKSAVYERADDTQREQMTRDLAKELGIKGKSAPSVDKILGTLSNKKTSNAEKKDLTQWIKDRIKAAKDATDYINGLRRDLQLSIAAQVKSGKITSKQAASLIKAISTVNLQNPAAVSKLIDYANRVFERADYTDKLAEANKLRKRINKARKGKDNQAAVSNTARNFVLVDPKSVEDIEEYIFMATKMLEAVMRTDALDSGVKTRMATDLDATTDYIRRELKIQEESKKQSLLIEYQDLVDSGVIDDQMSYDEIISAINALEPDQDIDDADKKQAIEDFLRNRFDSLKQIVSDMIDSKVNPVDGQPIDVTEEQVSLMKKLMDIRFDELSINDKKLAVEYLDNFASNEITDGVASLIEVNFGISNANKLVEDGYKSRSLKLFWSSKFGRIFGEQLTSLPMLVERMFGSSRRGIRFSDMAGINRVVSGVATGRSQAKAMMKEYKDKFLSRKGFNEPANTYERGIGAFLMRTDGTPTDFARRMGLVKQTIERLSTGTEMEQKKAAEMQLVFDKFSSAKNIDDVRSAMSQENLDAVNWWIQKWSENYDALNEVSRTVYNSILGADENYTPDTFTKVDAEGDDSVPDKIESAFRMSTKDYTVKKKTGVLMEVTKPRLLPKNMALSFDFDYNNSRAMEAALIDINTAGPIRQVYGFINSRAFAKMGKIEDMRLLKSRINSYIGAVRGKDYIPASELKAASKAINALMSIGAARALGGITQPIKQTVPVAINTLINAGRLDINAAFDADVNAWINKSGMPIANRGLDALTEASKADKYLDQSKLEKAGKVFEIIQKAGETWMKIFLANPDVFIARASFISYYKNELKKLGENPDAIDWTTHKPNQKALDFAQAMVDRQQNITDSDLAGDFMRSKDPLKQISRSVFFSFMNFVMNQKNRIYNDVLTISGSTASAQDKLQAARSLSAAGAEMFTYAAVSTFLGAILTNAAYALLGVDEPEEEKEKRIKYAKMGTATNFVNDLISPLPITNGLVDEGINKALVSIYEKNGTPEENRLYLFEPNEKTSIESLGAAGIPFVKLKEAYDNMELAATGKFEKEVFGKVVEKQLNEEDLKVVRQMSFIPAMYSLGLLPVEINNVNEKVIKIAKKRASSTGGSSGKNRYGSKFKSSFKSKYKKLF